MPAIAPPTASWMVSGSMFAMPLIVATLVLVLYVRARRGYASGPSPASAGAAIAGWMSLTASLALLGVLARFDLRPPPFGIFLLVALVLAAGAAFSRAGSVFASLPLAWLVGLQAFRVPLELVMHRAAVEGVMPAQMSYSGRNFDIVTGLTAAILAPLIARGVAPRQLIIAWNVMGSLLLANIVGVAAASTPAIRAFGSTPNRLNTWVAFFPYVWLPAVLVPTALMLHLVIAWALRSARNS